MAQWYHDQQNVTIEEGYGFEPHFTFQMLCTDHHSLDFFHYILAGNLQLFVKCLEI